MEIKQEDVEQFRRTFCPFGYRDMEAALKAYFEAGKTIDDLVQAIESFSEECSTAYEKIDPVYVAFDTLQQEARTEIENATGVDISNDEPYSSVTVCGNYMCTEFDGNDEAREATKKLIDTIEEKSSVVQWYHNAL